MRTYSGGRYDESALILPIPEIESIVQPYRQRYTADGATGLLPHITLLYPFAAESEWSSEVRTVLQSRANGFSPFTFQLVRLNCFRHDRVLFLEPEPNGTIINLIHSFATAFPQYPLYGGAVSIEDFHPHLTLAIASTDEELVRIENTLDRQIGGILPVTVTANEVWLVVRTDNGWKHHTTVTLCTNP